MYALQITRIVDTMAPTVNPANLIDIQMYTNDSLEALADIWIRELEITDPITKPATHKRICDKSFWYTNYQRKDENIIVRVFELKSNEEYWLTDDL